MAIKIYVAQRVAAGQFIVERDLWTLRSAVDAERRLHEPLPNITDLDAFVEELAGRASSTIHQDLLNLESSGALPLADRLGRLGTYIGHSPDTLHDPEAAFRLIEDGMDGENEDLADAIIRSLLPPMMEASVKAGTWQVLQRHLGGETRKWATEHYEWELALPAERDLFPGELQRIEDLIDAARSDNWRRFKALTDEPFINEEAMRDDQFAKASAAIRTMKMCSIIEVSASMVRGNRLVHAVVGDPTSTGRITVMIENIGNREGGPFWVTLFARQKRPFGRA